MDKTDKRLAWAGLIFGGGLSIAGNVRAAALPALPSRMDADSLSAWRAMESVEISGTALVIAVAFPVAAVLLVEMFNRWRWMPTFLRVIAIGTVAIIAALMSWRHLFAVLLHEGSSPILAGLGPLVPDVIAIVSAVALLSGRTPDAVDTTDVDTTDADTWTARAWTPAPDTDTRTPDIPEPLADADTVVLSTPVPDSPADIVPDSPADIPRPRTPRTPRKDSAWKVRARELIAENPSATDAEIAAKILADMPDTWTGAKPLEAGRKAVSRLR